MNVIQKRKLTDYHILSRFVRLTTPEGYDFAFIPEDKEPISACWRYDKAMKRHNIVINSGLERIMSRTKAYRNQLVFFQRVYDHEGAHSLETVRDFDVLNAKLKAAKIPFHLCNLFEDARIEARWRKRFRRRFNWIKYLLLIDEEPEPPVVVTEGKKEPQSAIRLFLDCKNMENSPRRLREWVAKDKDPKVAYRGKGDARYGRRHLIMWFYRRALHCGSTTALIPLMVNWCLTFPETAIETCLGVDLILIDIPGSAGECGMPTAAEDADGSPHKEIGETIKISGSARGEAEGKVAPKPRKEEDEERKFDGESKKVKIPRSIFFRERPIRKMHYKRGDRLMRLFERFLEGGEAMVTSRNPGSRINMRRWLRGSEDFYMRKGDDPYGVKRISFIMDCSGSMARALEDGVYLAYVLNELVRRRKIECSKMILCGGSNQAIKMPFHPDLLAHLHAPGSIEGFANAMRQYETDLLESKLTVFYTDGIITDEHIIKADWHRKGIYTVGLFVGDPSRSETLHQWFDSVLVRRSIEALADSLVQIIKR